MSESKDRHEENSLFFPHGRSPDAHGRILFIAIVTLSVVVVVVAMLHVYARYMLRGQARRRVTLQGIGLVARIHSEEPPKRGLEPTVIASLPILIYKDDDHGSNHSRPSPECAVCLSAFENGQMIRALPNCKHHFHAECIDKWLGSKSSCPICRHEVEFGPTISPLPREPSTRIESGMSIGPPSAPPLEHTYSVAIATEGTSEDTLQTSGKISRTNSRLSSFRRMLSMDRSSRHVNPEAQDGNEDLERQ